MPPHTSLSLVATERRPEVLDEDAWSAVEHAWEGEHVTNERFS